MSITDQKENRFVCLAAEEMADNKDPGAYIGLKMVMKLAGDVSCTSTMKVNNLRIRIDLPKESGSAKIQRRSL